MKPTPKKLPVLTMPVYVKNSPTAHRNWRKWQKDECDRIEAEAEKNGELDDRLINWLAKKRADIEADLAKSEEQEKKYDDMFEREQEE